MSIKYKNQDFILLFFVTKKYKNTKEIAKYTYDQSNNLKKKYNNIEQYLLHIRIKDRKSYSIDLATATGKSWVIYGVAQIMLAEGLVDKVLVLCPKVQRRCGAYKDYGRIRNTLFIFCNKKCE